MNKRNSIAAQEEVNSENAADGATLQQHPLMSDGWLHDDDEEFSTVHTASIADITRASDAVRVIARLVHNSLGEPEGSGAAPLGRSVEMTLCLGDYIFEKTEAMREVANGYRRAVRGKGGSNE